MRDAGPRSEPKCADRGSKDCRAYARDEIRLREHELECVSLPPRALREWSMESEHDARARMVLPVSDSCLEGVPMALRVDHVWPEPFEFRGCAADELRGCAADDGDACLASTFSRDHSDVEPVRPPAFCRELLTVCRAAAAPCCPTGRGQRALVAV